MTGTPPITEERLSQRLLTAAEASLSVGDIEPARIAADEVRAVDPNNIRAAATWRRGTNLQPGHVRQTGEHLHLPELLQKRAGHPVAVDDDPGDLVPDLVEAARLGSERGTLAARFRALVDVVRLPGSAQPDGRRDLLTRARADVLPCSPTDDTAAADSFLAG